MREIELRRHAKRQSGVDALSEEGRAQAEDVGRTLATDYASIFVSPARRAAETVAWFLRASGQQLPGHAVVPELGWDAYHADKQGWKPVLVELARLASADIVYQPGP